MTSSLGPDLDQLLAAGPLFSIHDRVGFFLSVARQVRPPDVYESPIFTTRCRRRGVCAAPRQSAVALGHHTASPDFSTLKKTISERRFSDPAGFI